MIDKLNVIKYIENRLKLIQRKHNFNPNSGKKQIKNLPELEDDFLIFQEYIKLIKKCKLNIHIKYDPLGLDKKSISKIKNRKTQVYFARHSNDPTIWKIGLSIAPNKRVKNIQVGNPEHFQTIYTIDGNLKLKNAIKYYTSKYHLDGGTEWRRLDENVIKTIIQKIKESGTNFLYKSKLDLNINS